MIRFLVPIRTVSALNSREHPMARSRRVKNERRNTLNHFRRSNPPEIQPLLVVILTRIGPRQLDKGDNLHSALKGVRDQVACILGVNDGGPLVDWQYGPQEIGDYGVRVEIRRFDEKPAAEPLVVERAPRPFAARLTPNVIRGGRP